MEEHVLDYLPAYALGCLDREEEDLVIRHLSQCEFCRAELSTYENIAGELSLAVPLAEPPEGLRQKVLQQIQEAQKPRAFTPTKKGWFDGFRSLSLVLRIAGMAIILALFASNLLLWREVTRLRAAVPDDFYTVALTGTEVAVHASGMIIVSPNGQHGTLVVADLPVLDSGHEYQLWLIRDDERTSGGVFSVSSDGYASIYVMAPQPLISYPAFGVTIEPAGGSLGPTGEKVLGGKF